MRFQSRAFFILNALGLLLLLSYFAGFWQSLDVYLFGLLNGSLTITPSLYNQFWALMNIRYADLIPLIFILLFFLFWQKERRLQALTFFISLLFLMLIVRECLDLYLEWKMLDKKSPSLLIADAILLSELYEFALKDSSNTAFPGDHAAVLLTWLGYVLSSKLNKGTILAVIIVMLFSLPRLIAGAHWASDILVGGLSIALISLGFGLYTPILNKPNQWLQKLTPNFIIQLFAKLPSSKALKTK